MVHYFTGDLQFVKFVVLNISKTITETFQFLKFTHSYVFLGERTVM